LRFNDEVTRLLRKNKENYLKSVKLFSNLLWAVFLSVVIPITILITWFTKMDLEHDTESAIHAFKIIDLKIILHNPYFKNR
jgi:hypothetical protein